MKRKKPEGHGEAASLLRKLMQVPKRELDREAEKAQAKSKKRAAKRKK